jgi:hypothetical protein
MHPPLGPALPRARTRRMGGPVVVEDGSSFTISSHCLQGLSPLAGPETGAGVQMERLMSGEVGGASCLCLKRHSSGI